MNRELSLKLFNEFPEMFRGRKMSIKENLMPFGFECGDGWYDLLYELCVEIKDTNPPDDFIVLQVKEKFGGLRFYVGAATDEVFNIIERYEQKSETVCEECGSAGRTRNRGTWLKTLCEKHAKEEGYDENDSLKV